VGIEVDVKKISNNLGDLYANIAMDVKKFNYLGDLYVGIIDLKWLYGS
jgi:hypothetical protein